MVRVYDSLRIIEIAARSLRLSRAERTGGSGVEAGRRSSV